jgi:hypothetical protein
VLPSVDIIDVYALSDKDSAQGGAAGISHSERAAGLAEEKDLYLNECSYYYTSPPGFMTGYAWPAYGPTGRRRAAVDSSGHTTLKHTLPAEERYEKGNYTFISHFIEHP